MPEVHALMNLVTSTRDQEARRKDHVLYFDELLGLYQAGISRDSQLCAADVLRNFVLRREVRARCPLR